MKITGADLAANALRSIPEHLRREKVLPRALTAGAKVVLEQAEANLRANGSVDTGTLVNTLTITRKADEVPGQVVVTLKPSGRKVVVGRKVRRPIKYAHFIETGREGVPARPFMRSAAETKRDEAVAKIREVTVSEVAKAARKAGLAVK